MKTKKKSVFNILMSYSGKYKILTYLSLVLSAMSGILSLIPFVYIWFMLFKLVQILTKPQTSLFMDGWPFYLLYSVCLFILVV